MSQEVWMRDPSVSVEVPPPTTPAWPDLTAGGRSAVQPDIAKRVSLSMLALGAGLLLFNPVGGGLFLTAGLLGLAIATDQ
jgi:hypothetical protein